MGLLQRIEMNNLKSIVNSNPYFLGGNNAVNTNDNIMRTSFVIAKM